MTTPIQLTVGDVEVFRWLWMLRVLTLEQIRRLRYFQPETGRLSSLDNVRKRLARLAQNGYLKADRLRASGERIYFPTAKALGPLREHFGIEQRRLYQPRGSDTLEQLLHPLMVSECAVRMVESVRETEAKLLPLGPLDIPFYHTHAVADAGKRRHVERYVSHEDLFIPGSPQPLRIRPDLVFGLAVGSARRLFFLEADRGTESPKELAQKLLGYAHYLEALDPESPTRYLWQRYGQVQDFRVLVVTTTERRIAGLLKVFRGMDGAGLVALARFEDVRSRNPLRDDVWTLTDGPRRAFLSA